MDTDEIEFQHIECTHLRVARLKLGRKRRFNLSSSNTTPTAQKIRVHPVHPWFLKLRRLVPIGFTFSQKRRNALFRSKRRSRCRHVGRRDA